MQWIYAGTEVEPMRAQWSRERVKRGDLGVMEEMLIEINKAYTDKIKALQKAAKISSEIQESQGPGQASIGGALLDSCHAGNYDSRPDEAHLGNYLLVESGSRAHLQGEQRWGWNTAI